MDAHGLKYAYEQAVKEHPEELTAEVASTGDPTDDPTDYGNTDVLKGLLNGTRKYWTSPGEQIYWERQRIEDAQAPECATTGAGPDYQE